MEKRTKRDTMSAQRHILLINARNRRIALLSLGLCVVLMVLALLVAGAYFLLQEPTDDGRILENVYAGGINIGNMTREEAKNALLVAIGDDYSTLDMVVHFPSASLTLSPAQSGAKLDLEAVLDAAFSYGRSGTVLNDNVTRAVAKSRNYTIPLLPYLDLDLWTIRSAIVEFCDGYSMYISQPSAYLQGERPAYYKGAEFEDIDHQTLILTTGTPQFILNSDDVYATVLDAYSLFELNVTYQVPDQVPPDALDLEAIFQKYCQAPQDAILNDKTFAVTPEVVGYGFNIDSVQDLVDGLGYGQQIQIPLKFLMPDITAEALSGTLFQDTLASFTSYCPDPNLAARNTNLRLSCQAINGYVLKPGQSFDFNAVVGPRTKDRGYLEAPKYSGSTTEDFGGGISQTASALHYVAMLSGLRIDERHTHRYAVNYTPELGTDAAISYGQENLVFTNTTSAPIRILASAEGSTVTVTLLGTREDSYASRVEVYTLDIIQPGTVYQPMGKDNVGGYKDGDVLQTAYVGYKVQVWLCRYDPVTGAVMERQLWYQVSYDKRDEVIVRIEDIEEDIVQ